VPDDIVLMTGANTEYCSVVALGVERVELTNDQNKHTESSGGMSLEH
jgi:hypothetical protein